MSYTRPQAGSCMWHLQLWCLREQRDGPQGRWSAGQKTEAERGECVRTRAAKPSWGRTAQEEAHPWMCYKTFHCGLCLPHPLPKINPQAILKKQDLSFHTQVAARPAAHIDLPLHVLVMLGSLRCVLGTWGVIVMQWGMHEGTIVTGPEDTMRETARRKETLRVLRTLKLQEIKCPSWGYPANG